MKFFIGRTAANRPSFQHRIGDSWGMTLCGIDASTWSRTGQTKEIPEIACRNCTRIYLTRKHNRVQRILATARPSTKFAYFKGNS